MGQAEPGCRRCSEHPTATRLAEAPKKFLPNSTVEFIEKNAGQLLEECAPDLNAEFIEQVDGIIRMQSKSKP